MLRELAMWTAGSFLAGATSWAAKIAFAAAFVWLVLWLRRRTPVVRRTSGGPDVRRWFRFRTSGLLIAMAIVAVAALLVRENQRTFLEGSWQGFKPQSADCSMLVHYDRLTIFENGQAKTFRMEFPRHFKAEEIDLYGPDGLQLGMYAGGDWQFELQLAEPGEPRPTNFSAATGGKSRFYVFKRKE
jgi:hypothetical protein